MMIKTELLQKLLASLNTRLLSLENTTREQMKTIHSTNLLTESITTTCITIQSNLKQNLLKESLHPSSSVSVSSSLHPMRSKTPHKSRNTSQGRLSKMGTTDIMSTTRSTQPKLLIRDSYRKPISSFTLPSQSRKSIPKTKSQLLASSKNKAMLAFRNSKASNTSKTSTNIINKGIISYRQMPSKSTYNQKGKYQSKGGKWNNKKLKGVFPSKSLDETNISKLLSIDPKYSLDKDDQLLLGPISDIDFVTTMNSSSNNRNNINKECLVSNWICSQYGVEELYEDYLPSIAEYLRNKELIPLMLVNKTYQKLIKQIILKRIQKQKEYYELRISQLEPYTDSIITLSEFQFSKGSIKAISLLNESKLNTLFTNSTPGHLPSEDILLIYSIYFQLINYNELAKESNLKTFWDKCCLYFTNAPKGLIGNLIQSDLTTKVIVSKENITAVLNLIKNNNEKITPSHFSKLCGTTGLIVFCIKDILDYFGVLESIPIPISPNALLSNDKQSQRRCNCTSLANRLIIDLLEVKINKLNQCHNENNSNGNNHT